MPANLPNLEFLRVFIAVSETKVLKIAAERLSLTPSAVSQALAKLETSLGAELFTREVRPLKLTAAGERLLAEARPLVAAAEALVLKLRPDSLASMPLRLGLSETATATVGPWLIAALYGEVRRLETHSLLTRPLADRLRNGGIDVMVSAEPLLNEDRWTRIQVYEENFLLVTPKNAPRIDSLEALRATAAHRPFVGYTVGSSDEETAERALRMLDVSPQKRISVNSSYALAGIVAETGGWSIVPPSNIWCGRQFLPALRCSLLPACPGSNAPLRLTRSMWTVGDRASAAAAVTLVAERLRTVFAEKMLAEFERAMPGIRAHIRTVLPAGR